MMFETSMAISPTPADFAPLLFAGEWEEAIDAALRAMLAEHELSGRKGLQPIRVAVSGSTVSPPLFESLEILGREESLRRISAARSLIG